MTFHIGRMTALYFAVLSIFFTSCDKYNINNSGKGDVILSLYTNIVFKSPAPISDLDDYNFRFIGVDGYATSEYYRYGDVSWPFKWYFGIYRLQAESCTLDEAEEGYGCSSNYRATG